jgi:8-oxo-dGTP pyrophosphatase MutT (NUDIX family)
LTKASNNVLKSIAAHLPLGRNTWKYPVGEGQWPQASVLVALTAEAEPRVLLGRRGMHLPLHPGEIAFAGGKREADDQSPWQTATREAMEEVGLSIELIIPLGEMEPLITRTGFEVFPCVASVPANLDLVVAPEEFDSVFFTPLALFADASLFRLETMSYGSRTRKVPHYQIGDDNVWGLTAAILVHLANVAYDAGFDLQRDWKQQP